MVGLFFFGQCWIYGIIEVANERKNNMAKKVKTKEVNYYLNERFQYALSGLHTTYIQSLRFSYYRIPKGTLR